MKLNLLLLCYLLSFSIFAQCPDFYDFDGNLTDSPVWIACDGNDYILSLQSNSFISSYSIDWGDGSAIQTGVNWSANSAITHTYNASIQNFSISIDLPDVPCTVSGTLIMEEPSNASIQIPFGGITSICAPGSIDFINSSTDVSENTVFTWEFNDGSTPEVYDHTNLGQTISHLYSSGSTNNCVNHVTLTAENECNTLQGGASTATFTPLRIWDIDQANIQPSSNVQCYPDTMVSYTNTTVRNCYSQGNISQRYEYWNFGDFWGLGYDSIIAWRPWPPSLPVDIHYPGTGTYEVMLIDSSFCGLDTTTTTVNIVDPPTAGLSVNEDSICAGESITFHNLSTGFANNYIWDFGNGTWWTQIWGGDINYTFFTPGTYVVSLIPQTAGTCRDTAQVTIHVLESPQPNFSLNNTFGCDSIDVQITDNSSPDVTNWNWNFGNGNTFNGSNPPQQTYDSVGVFSIQLHVENAIGCSNNQSQQITIYKSPIPSFLPTSVCVNEAVNFTDMSQSNDPIISWFWNFGNGITSTLQNPNITFYNAGIFETYLEVSTAFCQASDTIQFQIDSLPIADFNVSSVSGCSPLEISFSNTSSLNVTNYEWDFGDSYSSNLEHPWHTFSNSNLSDSVFTVSLIVSTTAGCKDTSDLDITIFSSPQADFNDNAILDCSPVMVDFTNTSQNATSYLWGFGDGNSDTLTNVSHTFINQGLLLETFNVSLIASNQFGCQDTSIQLVIVYPEPQFDFTVIPNSGCSPLDVIFPSVNGAVIYDWDFGDGNTSTLSSPTHTFTNSTGSTIVTNVQLIATSAFGCTDTNTQAISVFPNPVADFTTSDTTSCSQLDITISNNSSNANLFTWDFDDGNTSNNNANSFNYSFVNNGFNVQDHHITLVASNSFNCSDSTQKIVSVYPNVVANFSSDSMGCSPLSVDFLNTSIGANDFWWNFDNGDTAISIHPSELFVNNTANQLLHNVQLIATSSFGCTDTNTQAISVFPSPIVDFSVTPQTQTLPNSSVTITNNSSQGNWNYHWDFGDQSSSNEENPPVHQYNKHGDFPIQLIMNNQNCSDSLTIWVSILPYLPIANFQAEGNGCSPLIVQFFNQSANATSYSWDFGDGTYSASENPLKVYDEEGTYSVSLTAINNNGVHSIVNQNIIEVYASPNSYFTINTNIFNVPDLALETTNLSEQATHYLWDFGDSFTSTEINPTHYYEDNGNFIIKLVSYNEYCTDTSHTSVTVSNDESIIIPNSFTPNTNNINDGSFENNVGINDIFYPILPKVKTYKLDIYSRWGEHLFTSNDQSIGWNGYYKNDLCQTGVYVYKIHVVYLNNKEDNLVGQVTLVR